MTAVGLRVRRWCARCGVLTDAGWRCISPTAPTFAENGDRVGQAYVWLHRPCNRVTVVLRR